MEHWTKERAGYFLARNSEIHRRHRQGETYKKLAAEYGVGYERIRQIIASRDRKLLKEKYGPGFGERV